MLPPQGRELILLCLHRLEDKAQAEALTALEKVQALQDELRMQDQEGPTMLVAVVLVVVVADDDDDDDDGDGDYDDDDDDDDDEADDDDDEDHV